MAVLAVPMDKTFEVAVDKVENFDKKAKEHSGKHLLQDRLKKHNKGDVEWDLNKKKSLNINLIEFPQLTLK